MDINTLLAIFVLAGVMKLSSSIQIHPLTCALLATLPLYIYTVAVKSIFYANTENAIANIFSTGSVVTVLLQFISSAVLFFALEKNENEPISWFAWAVIGIVTIVFIIPFVVRMTIGL